MSLLSVDTGWNTGIAFFENKYIKRPDLTLIKDKHSKENFNVRLTYMVKQFKIILADTRPDLVIIEGVEFYGGSLKSVAATRRGDLFRLSYLVGAYCSVCIAYYIKFKIQTFNEWGGQMTPEVINNRIERATGITANTQHENDAIAMGLTYYGNKYFRELR